MRTRASAFVDDRVAGLARVVEALHGDRDALRREVVALAARVAVLESARGPRDREDRDLRVIVAQSTEGRLFTASALVAHATVDATLRAALASATLQSPTEIGMWLARNAGDLDGVTIRRVRKRWIARVTLAT